MGETWMLKLIIMLRLGKRSHPWGDPSFFLGQSWSVCFHFVSLLIIAPIPPKSASPGYTHTVLMRQVKHFPKWLPGIHGFKTFAERSRKMCHELINDLYDDVKRDMVSACDRLYQRRLSEIRYYLTCGLSGSRNIKYLPCSRLHSSYQCERGATVRRAWFYLSRRKES